MSRTSSLLMILLGLISFLFVNSELGLALMAIGVVMYYVYLRLVGRPQGAGSPPH